MNKETLNASFSAGYTAAEKGFKRVHNLNLKYQTLAKELGFSNTKELSDAWYKGYDCQVNRSIGEIFHDDHFIQLAAKKSLGFEFN